jgi:uncharacterized protein
VTAVSIVVHGEQLVLLPERAVFWPRTASLILADIHFGKSGHFGHHGIAVPGGIDATDRERLSALIQQAGARRLIVLGDLLHAPESYGAAAARELDTWAHQIGEMAEIHVVQGNHDRGAPRARLRSFHWWEEQWADGPFRFVHDGESTSPGDSEGLFSLSGHVHPVVRLTSVGKIRMRVPVFWLKSSGLVLPAFGVFTGGFAVRAAPGERLYAVSPASVTELSFKN